MTRWHLNMALLPLQLYSFPFSLPPLQLFRRLSPHIMAPSSQNANESKHIPPAPAYHNDDPGVKLCAIKLNQIESGWEKKIIQNTGYGSVFNGMEEWWGR